jgi:hypothetical protein
VLLIKGKAVAREVAVVLASRVGQKGCKEATRTLVNDRQEPVTIKAGRHTFVVSGRNPLDTKPPKISGLKLGPNCFDWPFNSRRRLKCLRGEIGPPKQEAGLEPKQESGLKLGPSCFDWPINWRRMWKCVRGEIGPPKQERHQRR